MVHRFLSHRSVLSSVSGSPASGDLARAGKICKGGAKLKVVPRVHGGSQVVGVELGMAVRCWGRVWRGGNDSVEVGVGVGLCVG